MNVRFHLGETAFRTAAGALLSALLTLPLPAQTSDNYAMGIAAYEAGDYSQAAQLLLAADQDAPGRTNALLYAAKAYIRLSSFPNAERVLRQYIQDAPGSAESHYLLGFVLHRENRPKESLEAYTKAASIERPSSDDLKIVALDYVLLHDNADAIHWLQRAVEMDPKNKDAWYYLGRSYYSETKLPEARRAYEKVLEIDPGDVKAVNNIGLIYESEAKPDEALAAYRKAISLQEGKPRQSEQPYLNVGSLLITIEKPEEAVAPLEKAASLAPANAQCHLRLGTAYMRLGRMKEAQIELEQAVQLDPDDASAHYQLARYYKQAHQLDAAKKEFNKVAEIQSRAMEKQRASIQH
jgi:tetratricopeptide (TPR) repeat protein